MSRRTHMKPKKSARKRKRDEKPPWSDINKKKEVFLAVMNKIAADPGAFTEDDKHARSAFAASIDVPANVRIIVLREGESAIKGGGSVVIEAPPEGSQLSDDQKMERFLCTYPVGW